MVHQRPRSTTETTKQAARFVRRANMRSIADGDSRRARLASARRADRSARCADRQCSTVRDASGLSALARACIVLQNHVVFRRKLLLDCRKPHAETASANPPKLLARFGIEDIRRPASSAKERSTSIGRFALRTPGCARRSAFTDHQSETADNNQAACASEEPANRTRCRIAFQAARYGRAPCCDARG